MNPTRARTRTRARSRTASTPSNPPARERVRINPNLFRGYASVPLYLITSYLYYQRETSAIPDATYDALCQHLLTHWDRISHPHKNLVVKESLNAGTGYDIDWKSAPKRIIASAESFAQGRHNL